MEEKIRNRIKELETALAEFVKQANTQIAAYEAAIGELKKLLEKDKPDA